MAPSPACVSAGLGFDGYDCSGLVGRVVSEVLGKDVADWPLTKRHVRDIWQLAIEHHAALPATALALGRLVIFRRRYDIDGQRIAVPGHIGIVSREAPEVHMIHANPPLGKVEEGPITLCRSAIIGAVALNAEMFL